MLDNLVSAEELARSGPVRFPNESAEYRTARTALLAEEIELRRHLERIAAQRRALPPGGEVIGDYLFEGEKGKSDFAGLFGDKDTLVVYSFMFGAKRERPCPMCTNLLNTMEGNAADIMLDDLAWWSAALEKARADGKLRPGTFRMQAARAPAKG